MNLNYIIFNLVVNLQSSIALKLESFLQIAILPCVKCAKIACVKSAGFRAQANYDDYLSVAPNTNF